MQLLEAHQLGLHLRTIRIQHSPLAILVAMPLELEEIEVAQPMAWLEALRTLAVEVAVVLDYSGQIAALQESTTHASALLA